MLICIACRPVSFISESTAILLLWNKKQTKQSHRRISLPVYVCDEKFTLILFRLIRILYEYYLPFMPRHTYDQTCVWFTAFQCKENVVMFYSGLLRVTFRKAAWLSVTDGKTHYLKCQCRIRVPFRGADEERGTVCTSCSLYYRSMWMTGKYPWCYNAFWSKWLAWPNKRSFQFMYYSRKILVIKIHKIQIYSDAHKRKQNNEGFELCLLSSGGS